MFDFTPFDVSPEKCLVTYSCESSIPNLCNLSNIATKATFDTSSLSYSFKSTDIASYGTQKVTFIITGTSEGHNRVKDGDIKINKSCHFDANSGELVCEDLGDSGIASLTFDLNLIDPCKDTSIILDRDIINDDITYGVHFDNIADVTLLDKSFVTLLPPSNLCPPIEFQVVNSDDSSLNSDVF